MTGDRFPWWLWLLLPFLLLWMLLCAGVWVVLSVAAFVLRLVFLRRAAGFCDGLAWWWWAA